jgi:hypothetical protein
MSISYRDFKLIDLFAVKSGNYHAVKELDPGPVPLISCGDEDQGLVGFFDVPDARAYKRALTVAYNGLPLTTKFHPYKFGAKDDVAVLIPRTPFQDATLFYTASLINQQAWRYSYGRKCFREKLKRVAISFPVNTETGTVDEGEIAKLSRLDPRSLLPPKHQADLGALDLVWKDIAITDLFTLRRGDFHSLADLASGPNPTVSRVTTDNGIAGYFEQPDDARLYKAGCLTVSTVGGDAFVQLDDFIATDNVVVCNPKKDISIWARFFIAFALNRQRWRYSYGRQCYLAKLKTVKITLPVNQDGGLDDASIRKIVEATPYWDVISKRLDGGPEHA